MQVYFSDTTTGLTRPAQELVGFRRVTIAPGAIQTITFSVQMDQLGYLGIDRTSFIIEPGAIEVLVGSGSDDIRARRPSRSWARQSSSVENGRFSRCHEWSSSPGDRDRRPQPWRSSPAYGARGRKLTRTSTGTSTPPAASAAGELVVEGTVLGVVGGRLPR